MAYRAGVVGASGYIGAELLRLLAGHPDIEVVHATAHSLAGAAVGEVYPSLLPAYERLRYAPFDAADLSGLDLVFWALPHGVSQGLLPGLLDHVGHAIDLGADFRLPPDVYSRWYGEAHRTPGAADAFAYGLVELYRDEIASHPDVRAVEVQHLRCVRNAGMGAHRHFVRLEILVEIAFVGTAGVLAGLAARVIIRMVPIKVGVVKEQLDVLFLAFVREHL